MGPKSRGGSATLDLPLSPGATHPEPGDSAEALLAAMERPDVALGGRLSLRLRTLESHRGRVLKKLGLKSQAQLVRFAHENGLAVPKDPPLSGNQAVLEGS